MNRIRYVRTASGSMPLGLVIRIAQELAKAGWERRRRKDPNNSDRTITTYHKGDVVAKSLEHALMLKRHADRSAQHAPSTEHARALDGQNEDVRRKCAVREKRSGRKAKSDG